MNTQNQSLIQQQQQNGLINTVKTKIEDFNEFLNKIKQVQQLKQNT